MNAADPAQRSRVLLLTPNGNIYESRQPYAGTPPDPLSAIADPAKRDWTKIDATAWRLYQR